MINIMLKAALAYKALGYSVIPVGQNKKALIKWEQYQKRIATSEEITAWWERWPDANIAIITGALSNLTVIDCDSQAAIDAIEEILPEQFFTPMQITPRKGKHYICKYVEGIRNRAGVMQHVDVRSEGGYFIIAPSINYSFLVGLSLLDIPPASLPLHCIQIFKEYSLTLNTMHSFSSSSSMHSFSSSSSSRDPLKMLISGKNVEKSITLPVDNPVNKIVNDNSMTTNDNTMTTKDNTLASMTTNDNLSSQQALQEGRRDADIYHIAHCLVKGGGTSHGFTAEQIYQILEIIAMNCNPPLNPKEIPIKIKSVLERAARRERNLTEEVGEWIMSTTGNFLSTDIYKGLQIFGRADCKKVTVILGRLKENGIIEKSGQKNGCWRKIDRSYAEQCWWETEGKPLPLCFPLGVGDLARIYPGNLMLLEGQKSQGKSAFALEFVRLNAHFFNSKVLYQNVEMSNDEFTERFKAYGDVMTPEQWRKAITIIRQTGDWWDKILPDGLNVVDYLIEYKESYLIADFIWKIHQKLKNGIALILVQRDPLKPYPVGGRGVRDIPRLIISLIRHRIKLEDVKSFYPSEYGNPSGLVRKYKQVNWWEFRGNGLWHHEDEEKYFEFKEERK